MALYWVILLVAAVIYVCGEFLEVDMALLSAEEYKQPGIIIQMLMVLLTLGGIPLALRLFKFQKIDSILTASPAEALLKWGIIRLLILGILLLANTCLYYLFGFEPAFGYLAVIVLLSMPFVLPTMSRCKAETEA
jgi:hypothetical protein